MNGILFDDTTVKLVPESLTVTSTWKNRTHDGALIAYDSTLIKTVYNHLEDVESPVMLDMGAGVGSFALLGVAIPTLWVTAFEPHPVSARILGKNVELNGLEKRVKILPVALWDEDGKAALSIPPEPVKAGLATLGQPKRFTGGEAIKVITRKLDSIVGMEHVDFIKIDVEGAELFVLRGGEQFIKRHRPTILVEYYAPNTAQFDYKPTAIRELLNSWGYTCHKAGKEDLWATPK